MLVDRAGFPLAVNCFEGNKAETHTIWPVIEAFQQAHGVADMVVVADAGMLSETNLTALDEAGFRFIVGSRVSKAPLDLGKYFHWHGDVFVNGQIIDTVTRRYGKEDDNWVLTGKEQVWDRQDTTRWRAVWQYSTKRFVRDNKTLNLQENRAKAVIEGNRQVKTTRFVKTIGVKKTLDRERIESLRQLAGLKGYVTNIEEHIMPAAEVISSYHDLWHVEQSFRMSKTDLKARPIFHHTKEAIEAHLTIVMTALAISRHPQTTTAGITTKRLIKTLRPLQQIEIELNSHPATVQDPIPKTVKELIKPFRL